MTIAQTILAAFDGIDTCRAQPEKALELVHATYDHNPVTEVERHGWIRYTFADYSSILVSIGDDGMPDGWKRASTVGV